MFPIVISTSNREQSARRWPNAGAALLLFLLPIPVRADYQVPLRWGQLQDDERAAVISILAGGSYTGRAVGRCEGQGDLEAGAKVELWARSVERAWMADAAQGYFNMPPAGEERDHLFWRFRHLESEVLLYTLPIEMALAPVDALYRIVDEWTDVGRFKLSGQDGELLFATVPRAKACGSAGCDSYVLLKRGGVVTRVGNYQPGSRGFQGACAVVLATRTKGINDLLEIGNAEGYFQHRWDGKAYDARKLAREPRTTCCGTGMDPTAATRCPRR